VDVYAGEGRRPYARNLPFVPGGEGADTVVGLGNGVDGSAVERQALDHKEAT
jgi:NADPH:quinone reductase-like Zn-dependent oxidoreductase